METFYHHYLQDLGKPGGYLALPARASLLCGPLFCCLLLLLYGYFYISYSLLIVCGDVKSNPGPGSDKRVWVLYSNIRGLHSNLDELAEAGSDYDILICSESKV